MSQASISVRTKANKFDSLEYNDFKLHLHHKPAGYHEQLNLGKSAENLSEEQLEKLKFPCIICLVNAACREHCLEVFRYMNYIADHIKYMTADEICVYRHMVPNNVRKKIEEMYRTSSRLAHPKL